MRKGFAPLLIIGIIAVASLVAAGVTAALSALNEQPGSGMYGLQRLAEGSPTNLARYFSKNYTKELLEKRENETQAVLRSGGKDAALAFAKKEGTLTKELEYEIASYVPLIDRAVRSMGTVLRLTTPGSAPLGREFILAPGKPVRFGNEIVLEVGENPREIVKSDRRYAYVRWEELDAPVQYAGIRAVKEGGLVIYDFNRSRVVAQADDNICSRTMGLCALFDNESGMVKFGEFAEEPRLDAYFVRGDAVLGYARVGVGDVFAGYRIWKENVSRGVFRVRVAVEAPKTAEFVKICGYADYLANWTACGADLRRLDINVTSNGKPVGGLYYLRIKSGSDNVCLSSGCVEKSAGKVYENSLIALFSADGRDWKNRSGFLRESGLETYEVFHWNFGNATDRIVALLPDGKYSFYVDLAPCLACRVESQKILEVDAGQGNASLGYSARQEHVSDLNFYINVYGSGSYRGEADAVRDAYKRFASLTGKIPESLRAFNMRTDLNPFGFLMLSRIKSGEAAAYYVPEGYSPEDNRIEILPGSAGSVCHELAHALYFENARARLGPEFEEGFAISICKIEQGAPSFGECISRYGRDSPGYLPHNMGRCIFQALNSGGYITEGFWRRLLDFPCQVLTDADPGTEQGRNLWYYVLSTVAGKNISGFPHTGEKGYCGRVEALPGGPPCRASGECGSMACYNGRCVEPKLTLLFLPVNWKGTMGDFSAKVDERVELLLNALPLRDCKGRVKVIKGTEPCRVASYESAGLEKIRECASLVRSDYVIGLTDSVESFLDVAEGIAIPGMRATLVTTERVFTTAHEIGHAFGLKDEYCNFQVGGVGKCGFGVGPNPLKSGEGCREEDSPYDKDGYPDCCVSGGYTDACSGNVGLSESAIAEQAYARGVYNVIDGILGNKSYLENNRGNCTATRKGVEDALAGLERGITELEALQKGIGFTPGPVWPALQEFKNHSALCRESGNLCGCVNGIDFVLALNSIKYGLKTRFYLDDFVRFNSRNIMVNDHGAKNGSFEFSKPAYDYLGTLPEMRCD